MNPTPRERQKLARRVNAIVEDRDAVSALIALITKTGITDDPRPLMPGLRARDYKEIEYEVARLRSGGRNRHEKRAHATVDRRRKGRLERRLDWLLPAYERALASLTPHGKAIYDDRLKRSLHPDGRFYPSALDSEEIKELLQSHHEVRLLLSLISKWRRKQHADAGAP